MKFTVNDEEMRKNTEKRILKNLKYFNSKL